MAVVSVVKLAELEGAKRIDAEYYQPVYAEAVKKIIKCQNKYKTVRSIGCKVVSGPFGSSLKSEAYLPEGIPFVRIQNLEDFFINKEELVHISHKDNERLSSSQLKVGDLVLSKVGNTIGVVAIVTDDIGKCNISENNIGIKFPLTIKGKIKSFVLTFLNSGLGQSQILRRISGNAQPKLNVKDIYDIILYLPRENFLNNINGLVLEAKNMIGYAKSYYYQGKNLLLEELGLKDFKLKHKFYYTASLSKAFGVHRVDAEYFQPAYDEIVRKIVECPNGYTQLLSCVESIKPNFDRTKHFDKTFSYVELADIDASIGVIHSVGKIKGEEAPSRARRILRQNDVIVSRVEGSLEKVALVNEEYEGSLASTGFFQFRPIEIPPELLLVLSKSIVLQAQLRKECSGTILTAVSNESLKRILIPIMSQETQQTITSLVRKSHKARKKAKELLGEAKRKVEEIIEYSIEM